MEVDKSGRHQVNGFERKYPYLFNEVTWSWGPTRAKFILLEAPPPPQTIANVNIVPRVGDRLLVLQHEDGSWDVPGGTLEAGESYLETARRELIEEAGAKLASFSVIGAWRCQSLATEPYRSHLPHPDYYRITGLGRV
jgi:8-oxo-dGTP diphosphatase